MHLILDGHCEPVMSVEELEAAMVDTVEYLDVSPVLPVTTYVDVDGVTLIQIIAESHICIHTVKDIIHIDIFSCREFNTPETAEYLIHRFHVTKVIHQQVLTREFGVG